MGSRRSLLDGVHPSEIEWDEVAWVLESREGWPFVYFIGEENDGPIKIGTATDPIKRLRSLQTGNPRRLKIERLIYGATYVERLVHRYFEAFRIGGKPQQATIYKTARIKGTEWFAPEARPEILEAAEAILRAQRLIKPSEVDGELGTSEKALHEATGAVLRGLGYEIRENEGLRLPGKHGDYVEIPL